MDFAASIEALKASAVEMSGFCAPLRTKTPTPMRATSRVVSGTRRPFCSSAWICCRDTTSTSTASPASTRLAICPIAPSPSKSTLSPLRARIEESGRRRRCRAPNPRVPSPRPQPQLGRCRREKERGDVPLAASMAASSNDRVGPCEERIRDGEPDALGGLQIDDEMKRIHQLDRHVAGCIAQENALDILCRVSAGRPVAHAIARERPFSRRVFTGKHGRYLLFPQDGGDELGLADDEAIRHLEKGVHLCGTKRAQAHAQLIHGGYFVLHDLHVEPGRDSAYLLRRSHGNRIAGHIEDHRAAHFRHELLQELEALRHEIVEPAVNPGESACGLRKACDQARADGIGPCIKDDRNALRRRFRLDGYRGADRVNHIDALLLQAPRVRRHGLEIAFHIPHVQDELLPILESQLAQTLAQSLYGRSVRPALEDDPYPIQARLLRPRARNGHEGESGCAD